MKYYIVLGLMIISSSCINGTAVRIITQTSHYNPNINSAEMSWLRIKRRCGIPDSESWSLKTKIKYGKQIEKVIREMDHN